ncbi:MAG: putative heme transporter [Thermoleophilaceae bacterium]|nr:putative heme transporter [Thermoleophilaceae bacterium]
MLVAALFAGVVLLLGGLVPGAGRRLSEAEPAWLVLAVVLELVACTGYVALFHAVFARPPIPMRARRSAQIALAELGGFAVVPAGVGGPAARIWGLRRAGMSWRMLGVRTIAHAPIFNVPYITAALVLGIGVLVGAGPGHAPVAVALAPVGVVLAALLVFGAITAAVRLRRLDRPTGWRHTLREVLRLVPEGIREVPGLLRNPRAMLGAIGFWVGDCAVLWAAFHAVGSVPPLGVIALGYMLGQLGNALPLPGGVGGVEPVMLGVLTASGVGAGAGAAAIVCYRAIALGVQATLGAVAVGTLAPEIGRPRRAGG